MTDHNEKRINHEPNQFITQEQTFMADKMNKFFKTLMLIISASVIVYFAAALVLAFLPAPEFALDAFPGGTAVSTTEDKTIQFTMRDGESLSARQYTADSTTTIVLLHGVTAESSQFNRSAEVLREAAGATVVTLDLRGHGQSGGASGDIAYIGQYEDDVADVITAVHADNPNGQVILAGHSMGGGIALRYATLTDEPAVDGYLLFAPHLGANSPTVPTEISEDSKAFVQIHLPRIIGLAMLNNMRITALNGKDTLFFNLSGVTSTYSYRAMMNASPADYVTALTAVNQPMLVVVGSNDEAFVAEQFPTAVTSYSDGAVHIVDGESHTTIVESAAAMTVVEDWLSDTQLATQH